MKFFKTLKHTANHKHQIYYSVFIFLNGNMCGKLASKWTAFNQIDFYCSLSDLSGCKEVKNAILFKIFSKNSKMFVNKESAKKCSIITEIFNSI